MKTLPVVFIKPNIAEDIMLRECVRRDVQKIKKHLFIAPPEQKPEQIELISEKENERILELMNQINKDIFGK